MSVIARLFVLYFKCNLAQTTDHQNSVVNIKQGSKIKKINQEIKNKLVIFCRCILLSMFVSICDCKGCEGMWPMPLDISKLCEALLLCQQTSQCIRWSILYCTVQYSTVRWSLLEWTLCLCSPRQSSVRVEPSRHTSRNSTKTCVLHVWSQYTHLIK